MANPKIDLTPSPLHGTFQYCGRVSVNALPTPKVESYGKTYQVTVVPSKSIPHGRHSMIQICFHRNDSLGLCQCDKDDWMAIQKGSWSSFMPPHEKRIVDVKFAAGISHFVTVALDEVSPAHGWRHGLLAGYIALSFIAVSKYMFAQDGAVHSVKRVMCVLALTCLFKASDMVTWLYWHFFAYGSSRFLFSHLLHDYFYHVSFFQPNWIYIYMNTQGRDSVH
ncbi:hypothetical protein HanXRQr2_Chr01g0026671 [Helianthus annuus]|uniref:Uncharacterized protein n=1 Tax=Helianthus annuus TaxID=4232 RepID=A0A9K3JWL6_HELAN|nr:hypothetical protein HanXRQr2_Chr01g0026671 [Helianthus annuus]KAJ0611919.1 hypothetical protein HanHA300_Chr01g0021291 [Helianthus annuus]KAJ0627280.1 hypothetical protein HanHA89_Chr01g0023551 [Helianthus annuus]